MKEERIILGSGILYVTEWTGGTLPGDSEIEVEDNKLGEIKGGASLVYTPTYYEPVADSGRIFRKLMTEEVAMLRTGIMTINANMLDKLISTGRLTETETMRTLKIGGPRNHRDIKYVVHFLHKDADYGDIRVTIVGSNNTGLEFAFAKNNETIINAEFKAVPQDASGTLILYKEEIPGD